MKTKAKHTEGSWRAVAGIGRWNVTTTGKPRTLNICSINSDRLEQEANARLIAAAPELLAAAKKAAEKIDRMDDYWFLMDEMELLKAAIAKAEGE